jgi:hypothetical protein
VGKLAYRIALPPDLIGTHDVFHVSMLRKYIANPEVIVEYEPLGIQEGLTYVEEPVLHKFNYTRQLHESLVV